MATGYDRILDFWFKELSPADHWKKDPAMDEAICTRFGPLHRAATQGELWQWRESDGGRLAEIIMLDQFSRNIYRDRPESFAWDGMALILAQEAIRCGADMRLPAEQRAFIYMPLMHSESLAVHQQARALFKQPGLENNYQFELQHLRIIERFGRYPHRNEILGRRSSAEEREFLAQPGSSF